MVPAPRRLLTPVLCACLAAAASAQSFDADAPASEAPFAAAPALTSFAQVPTVSALSVPVPGVALSAALPARVTALAAAANGVAERSSGDALRSWTAARSTFDGAPSADPPSVSAKSQEPAAPLTAATLPSRARAATPPPPYRRAVAAGGLAAAFNGAGLSFAAHALASHAAVPVLVLAAGGGAHLIAFAAASAAAYFAWRGDAAGLRKTLIVAAGALGLGAAGLAAYATFTHGGLLLSSAFGLTASNLFADAQALKRMPADGFDDAAVPAVALETFAAPTALLAAQTVHPALGLAVALSYRYLSNDYLKTHVPMPRLPPVPPNSGNPPPQSPPPPTPPPPPVPPPSSR